MSPKKEIYKRSSLLVLGRIHGFGKGEGGGGVVPVIFRIVQHGKRSLKNTVPLYHWYLWEKRGSPEVLRNRWGYQDVGACMSCRGT